MTKVKDKTILITGAASGIGRLLAIELAAKGARLVLWDIDDHGLQRLTQEIKAMNRQVFAYHCDVGQKQAIEQVAQKVLQEVGDIDILINNAGVVFGKSFLEYTDAEIEKTIAVDLMAIIWTLRAFLPSMIRRNEGHIVTISSAAGTIGVARLAAYCSAKFAAFGLDESLRMEFRKARINVKTTVVCPYYIATGMFAGVKTRFPMLLPILKPERVVRKIIRAIERDHARLIMPAMVFSVPLLRLIPVRWFDWLTNFFGINASMDEYIGRNFNREDFMLTNRPQPELKATHTECFNPATGELLGYSRLTTVDELTQIVERARAAQIQWAEIPLKHRIKYLHRVRDYLAAHAQEIAEIISRDNGKVRIDAMATEVLPATMAVSYYMRMAPRFLRPVKCGTGNLMLANKRSRIIRQPFGVIGIISPWNYPFAIPFSEVVMALLAGNSVILKTASETQLVGRMLEQCFLAADLPPGVFNYVNLPGKVAGEALLKARIDKLFFTGSVAVGKQLMALAAETLTPVVLELGGNDPMIVCEDADIYRAVGGAIWAGFSNCGQSCGGVERIYVDAKIYETFLSQLKERIEKLRIGLDLDFNVDMGIMTTARQVATVESHIADALAKGARIYAQTPLPENKGWHNFLPATVLVDVNHDMLVMRDETFGPVVGVMPFNTIDEAIALANDSYLGLTASVWSRDRKKALQIAQRLKAGAVTINDHLMSHGLAETPWGGFKMSGIGRTHGKLGFDEMTQPQVIVNDILPCVKKNMWWQPYSRTLYDGLSGLVTFLYGKGCWARLIGMLRALRIFPRYFTK